MVPWVGLWYVVAVFHCHSYLIILILKRGLILHVSGNYSITGPQHVPGFTLFIDTQTVITALPCYDEWCRTFHAREKCNIGYQHLSHPTCSSLLFAYYCRLLITYATVWTKTRPDKMSGLIWIQTVWHSVGIPEIIFFRKKKYFEKNQKTTKTGKISPVGKE